MHGTLVMSERPEILRGITRAESPDESRKIAETAPEVTRHTKEAALAEAEAAWDRLSEADKIRSSA